MINSERALKQPIRISSSLRRQRPKPSVARCLPKENSSCININSSSSSFMITDEFLPELSAWGLAIQETFPKWSQNQSFDQTVRRTKRIHDRSPLPQSQIDRSKVTKNSNACGKEDNCKTATIEAHEFSFYRSINYFHGNKNEGARVYHKNQMKALNQTPFNANTTNINFLNIESYSSRGFKEEIKLPCIQSNLGLLKSTKLNRKGDYERRRVSSLNYSPNWKSSQSQVESLSSRVCQHQANDGDLIIKSSKKTNTEQLRSEQQSISKPLKKDYNFPDRVMKKNTNILNKDLLKTLSTLTRQILSTQRNEKGSLSRSNRHNLNVSVV